LQGFRVDHDLFEVLGVRPALGRSFTAEEDQAGGARVAILGHALWQSRFGGSSSVIGRSIVLDDVAHTVVGVMPAGFDYPARGAEIWTPMAMSAEQRARRSAYVLNVIARLRPGTTLAQARDEMAAMAARLNADSPGPYQLGAAVVPLRDELVGDARTAVLLLFSIAACVLLIASANLANLVLARAVERQRDVAVRIALGAGRGRVFRQLVTEHFVLSLTGTVLGVVAAVQVFAALSRLVPRDMTSAALVLDRGLFLFAATLCVSTTVLLGALPSRLAVRLGLAGTLRQVDSRAGASAAAARVRSWLIAGQTAFAVVLLIAAGLMTRTFARLSAVDPGFRGQQVLTMRTELPVPRYSDPSRRSAFYTGVVERVRALPGVESAGFTTGLPLVFPGGGFGIEPEGRPQPANIVGNVRLVTPGYLAAMGMTLRAGRLLEGGDGEGSEPVAVINATMAQRFWPGEDPLDLRFRSCAACPWLRVVGVVEDMPQESLSAPVRAECYVPFAVGAASVPFMQPKDLAVRATADPMLLLDRVRAAIWEVDPTQPISQVRIMADYVDDDLGPHRLQAQLTGVFAAFALLLAAVGVYGVLSYAVAQRRHEMGLRMALGAERGDLVRWVVARGLRPVLAGVVVGLAAAYGLASLIAGLLYDVRPRDPLTFAAAAATLLLVALVACWIPARRAAHVDPLTALRAE
jgi:predicted permease